MALTPAPLANAPLSWRFRVSQAWRLLVRGDDPRYEDALSIIREQALELYSMGKPKPDPVGCYCGKPEGIVYACPRHERVWGG